MTDASAARTALVLGGGGITGIAWELGVLAGLAEAGVDVTGADVVVGTSAGSIVGAQVTSGRPVDELWRAQLHADEPAPLARVGARQMAAFGLAAVRSRGDARRFKQHVGAYALHRADHGHTPTQAERRAVISLRLPVHEWPERDLRVCTVDAVTGERWVIGRDDGVLLVDAVASSCAVPGVYPPVDIGGRAYVDGGMHASANVDVAAGAGTVVVLSPMPRGAGPVLGAQQQLDELGPRAAVLLSPDETSRAAIGRNVLDPAARPPSARAGHAQGLAAADDVRRAWAA